MVDNRTESDFCVGQQVRKVGGDYAFEGAIVAKFAKLSGQTRFVVEHVPLGILHIYSAKNLERMPDA